MKLLIQNLIVRVLRQTEDENNMLRILFEPVENPSVLSSGLRLRGCSDSRRSKDFSALPHQLVRDHSKS